MNEKMLEESSQKVILPETNFPMRANLPIREGDMIAYWQEINFWQEMRKISVGRKPFILHDGPPYANGNLHIGHAVNKILKDVINRAWHGLGYDAHYVPGWDCHGLPIEWKVEENFRETKKDKKEIPINDFRAECRKFAQKWVAIQSAEFQRLGIMGDWQQPYLTMAYEAEAIIAENIGKFLLKGMLYKGARPIMWSVVERTALAEAEIEYRDYKSPSLWVSFPIANAKTDDFHDVAIVIWTTTPWTLPGNRGIAYHQDLDYVRVQVNDANSAMRGRKFLLAKDLVASFQQVAKLHDIEILGSISNNDLHGLECQHPLFQIGYHFTVPMHHADFVTAEQGTGFVHIGPANGSDDYQFALKHGLEVPDNIADDGSYRENVPLFAGRRVLNDDGSDGNANGGVIGALQEAGNLLAKQSYRHSYPHSWRSKAPVIYRNTAQWFIALDNEKNQMETLRKTALNALEAVEFFPKMGKERLQGMIANRPDWCVSRQRAWGVPLPIFIHRKTGDVLRDPAVLERIIVAFRQEGADCWFVEGASARFLADDYPADDYEQVQDVVDVWFDSGSTYSFVLNERMKLIGLADLYLEGSDQHRGWFHSSLLVAAGLQGIAPYKAVLTHGFALDKDGRKMSKSVGNTIAPEDVIQKYGADILRLWVVSVDYSDDMRIGDEILKRQIDVYRKIRNSLRFLLGNLPDQQIPKVVSYADFPELEQYILVKTYDLAGLLQENCKKHDYTSYIRHIHEYCQWISYGYFDIRKDCLYCDRPSNPKRQAAQYVLHLLFDFLVTRIAPILCFTAEEAWLSRYGKNANHVEASVFFRGFSAVPAQWQNPDLQAKWAKIFQWRELANVALEFARREGRIKSGLEAELILGIKRENQVQISEELLAEIMITHSVVIEDVGHEDVGHEGSISSARVDKIVDKISGNKCRRCYKIVTEQKMRDGRCKRCHDVYNSGEV